MSLHYVFSVEFLIDLAPTKTIEGAKGIDVCFMLIINLHVDCFCWERLSGILCE